ncbi:bifunctional 3-(3-hydroxy-phenyl)propionate/3-hydroxycinnamic acid hydroxylase [Streptomyces sp. enrichment culture]|uniref:bifunctional 3-(3-hydroxy-phenyl)propionate/3-hydroxycinnamic acid hydroxylase n=1 Tax=Streptomyces sp. enrichment culture TaxID=1795815 RepID=UPI003F57A08E
MPSVPRTRDDVDHSSTADSGRMHDLLIIGGGSVGLTMGATWAMLGRDAVVFDRQQHLYGLPRVGHIDHEIMRMLQQLGAEGPTLKDAYATRSYTWINAEGETLLEFPWGEKGISGWHSDYMQNSAILERSLLDRIRQSETVAHMPGWEVVDLVQFDDHVELTVERTRTAPGEPRPVLTGEQRRFRGRYVIACDGANSRTRQRLGIERDDLGFNEKWLVVDARIKRPFSLAFDSGQVCDPRRPTTVLPLGKDHRRWEWHLRPDENPEDFLRPDKAWELLAPFHVTPQDVEPVRQLVYTFEARIAHRWRSGRVFLAGDAAHTMPPFMGQGMCSGMRDARNLAWKLDLVLSGKADETLLDTYQVERDPHVRDWTVISLESGKIPCIIDPEEARKRDEMFRAGFRPPMPDFPQLAHGVLHRSSDGSLAAPAGELGLQGRVRIGDRTDLLDRLLPTTGFTVVSVTGDPRTALGSRRTSALERLGCAFHTVRPPAPGIPDPTDIVDVDGTYAEYFRARDVEVVINRPDFYVFGGSDMTGLTALADDLLRQTTAAAPVPAVTVGQPVAATRERDRV